MTTMMSLNALPSAATVYGAYASVSSSIMLLKTTYHQIVPRQVHSYVVSAISRFFKKKRAIVEDSLLTLVVEQFDPNQGYQNHIYSSFEIYMSNKATPVTNRLKIAKLSQKSNQVSTRLAQEETITDVYKGVEITWFFFSQNSKEKPGLMNKLMWFELRFEKKHKDVVLDSYIQFVMDEVKTIQNAKRDLLLYTYGSRSWSSVNLEHSSTFETLAMEPREKKALMDDLDLFVKRRDFFKRVGRAWKRGYLLYGPPGTGKSSLVAAMANYLKFDIYDLQLMNVSSDSWLRSLLMGIANRSILVIEDIDCSADLPDRKALANNANSSSRKFSLSGLLNFIDGIWSSCGDERIIVFTTNNKDKLDPALLRPGRMDMHIHMSYLTANGFKTLASTYLEITDHHWRFREIEELLGSIEVTPAEVAEELMRACDADVCLGGLVSFLKEKKRKRTSIESKDGEDITPESKNGEDTAPEPKDGEDTALGVEVIRKAKKVKTNDSQDGLHEWWHQTLHIEPYRSQVGLYGWCDQTRNGIAAPGSYFRLPYGGLGQNFRPSYGGLSQNFETDAESNPIGYENIEDDYNEPYMLGGMDDEDSEMSDEDGESD